MKCADKKCPGEIELDKPIRVLTSCSTVKDIYACKVCELLHEKSGTPAKSGDGQKAYFKNGKICYEK